MYVLAAAFDKKVDCGFDKSSLRTLTQLNNSDIVGERMYTPCGLPAIVKISDELYYLATGCVLVLWGKDEIKVDTGKDNAARYRVSTHSSYTSREAVETDESHPYRAPLMLFRCPRPTDDDY